MQAQTARAAIGFHARFTGVPRWLSQTRAQRYPDAVNDVIVDDDVLDGAVLAQLRADLRASKLVGESQLVGAFEATRGFGLACHVAAVELVAVGTCPDEGVPVKVTLPKPPPPAATAAVTNAVLATCVVLVPGAAVGAVGTPVSAGLAASPGLG